MVPTLQEIKEKYKNFTPVPILDIAAFLGLEIYETDSLKENESGAIKKENEKFVIYVNQFHSYRRKRFTIAHEVVHYLLHRDLIGDGHITNALQPLMRKDGKRDAIESEANKEAAKILMPEEKFVEVWRSSGTIEKVADVFEVSVAAAAIRGEKLLGETII